MTNATNAVKVPACLLLALAVLLPTAAPAEDKKPEVKKPADKAATPAPPAVPEPTTYRVTGLFSPVRVEDFRKICENLSGIKLVSVDYDAAEATFVFEWNKDFPRGKPEQVLARLDNAVRTASRSTFGIKPRCTLPKDKLTKVEIGVVGLDCKACELAAYEIVAKLDGVEQATASFRDGLIVAWLDPAKIARPALEEALKKRNVKLKGQ
jgi:copper chaperone CopZ